MTKPSLYEICVHTAKEYRLSEKQILSRNKTYDLSHPRQVAMFLSCCHGHSTTQIGRFYKRDHSSVIFARNAVTRRLGEDTELRYTVARIDEMVKRSNGKKWELIAATAIGSSLRVWGVRMEEPVICVSTGVISASPLEPSCTL